ncbi:HNH endonuclease [Paenibacillaceae bacterium]|nr:HNH endonuclease [Paenibacillaceae bacterium]
MHQETDTADAVKQSGAAKACSRCGEIKPLTDFLRRTGKRSGKGSRRGTCKACRKLHGDGKTAAVPITMMDSPAANYEAAEPSQPRRIARTHQRALPAPPSAQPPDVSILRPTRRGILWMRGRTDKGRRWQQETDLETAAVLVKEYAAVIVNQHTVRRLYSNKKFRQFILTRDQYTCFFCGEYGDTIDHLLPRAKGGHTTPLNCVCACNLCNQTKADSNVDDFIRKQDSTTRQA